MQRKWQEETNQPTYMHIHMYDEDPDEDERQRQATRRYAIKYHHLKLQYKCEWRCKCNE